MFPQSVLSLRKNGPHFGFRGRRGLSAKLSNAFVKWGDLHNYQPSGFPRWEAIGTPVYSDEGSPLAPYGVVGREEPVPILVESVILGPAMNVQSLEFAQRLVGVFGHASQDRGVLVQERLEPGPHVPQFYLVTLRIGFRT